MNPYKLISLFSSGFFVGGLVSTAYIQENARLTLVVEGQDFALNTFAEFFEDISTGIDQEEAGQRFRDKLQFWKITHGDK